MARHDIPGSTYRVSNASIVSSRKLLGREKVVPIQFTQDWVPQNPLFDWYVERSRPGGHIVRSIQLRKERKQPFFHEYLVLCLGDESYFRLERRQLENEDQPLDSLLLHGVEAYDTLEETTGIENPLHPSDCLAQVDFKDGIHVAVILEICRAIHKHPSAKVYTLQRFNCYFFAQTVLLCSGRMTYQSNDMKAMVARIIEKYDGKPQVYISSDVKQPVNSPPLHRPPNSDISPWMMLKEDSSVEFSTHINDCPPCWKRSLWIRGHLSGHKVYSVKNIQGLFWGGASHGIAQVLRSINTGSAFQNVLWSIDSAPRLENICNAFIFWIVRDEWDVRLSAFQKMHFEPTSSSEQPEDGCTDETGTSVTHRFAATQDAHPVSTKLEPNPWNQPPAGGNQPRGDSDDDRQRQELMDFLGTSYFAARKKLMELVSQACNQNDLLNSLLSTYYDPSHWSLALQTRPLHLEPESNNGSGKAGLLRFISRPKKKNMISEIGFKPLHDYVLQLIQAHADNVGRPALQVLLGCTSDEIAKDMKAAMDDVWKCVCAADQATSVWEK